jgi:phosphoglycolate phosphatase
MSQPVIITVAITGALPRKKDNPAVPITPAEQIESTHQAYEAGASLVHIHVRNPDESPSSDPALFARARPLYKAAYATHLSAYSCLYPGVREGLVALREAGFAMACVTNKAAEFAEPLLERLDISPFFATVVGGECTAHPKPAPDALWLCAERLGVPIARGLMIGDSLNDVGAARNAGCPVVCVPYGYNHGHDIRDARPDAVIDSIAALPALLGAVH